MMSYEDLIFRGERMTDKRFKCVFKEHESKNSWSMIKDNQLDKPLYIKDVVDLLNEQQELIEELHISDHMVWGRAEKFEKELKQKKIYIKRLEYKVQKFKEMNGEQQATIRKLQDLCGESDGENMKLRNEIKLLKPTNIEQYEQIVQLQKENEQLRQSVEYWQKKYEEGTETFQIN